MKPGTIFASSTASGKAGVAVIRISGDQALSSLDILSVAHPVFRQATRAILVDPKSSDTIDDALIFHFPKPNSFTGEDVVELHTHGSRAVVTSLLRILGEVSGFRMAEPGEFTRRAFENGKIDLTAAEGIVDLIEAETIMQSKQALRQMQGGLGKIYEEWRYELIKMLSYLEATIDFSDEEIPGFLLEKVEAGTKALIDSIEAHLADGRRGERIRDGINVAILGEPNVGKSSLLNALVDRDVAIVSKTAGTTRDVIEAHLGLGGYPVNLFDTAGIRTSSNALEAEGVRRALAKAADADLKLIVLDGSCPADKNKNIESLKQEHAIVIYNKSDLLNKRRHKLKNGKNQIHVSAKTGENIALLLSFLESQIKEHFGLSETASITRTRHRLALVDCINSLRRVWNAQGAMVEAELAAEELRLASRALGRITGRVDVEDILDKIFDDFCIGK